MDEGVTKLTQRQIEELIWGTGRVAGEAYPDSWMNGRVDCHIAKNRALLKCYRDIAVGRTARAASKRK
ncbi:MAG: hypothetical protein OXI64_06020 [Defluviicoccus sp.]|nr:hypothetical protein [Defluviicoccus sp.]MDE2915545.1 hypothetical protein [Paracoccaceae bacterium]